MLQSGETWFLLADGRRARVFAELARGAPLQERADWNMVIGAEDLYEATDRPPRAYDSVGGGRHAMDDGRNLHEEEEGKFLKRLADRLGEAEKAKQFEHLVVAAPPRALGLLREKLSKAVQARVRAETAKDLVGESGAALRERLTELLR